MPTKAEVIEAAYNFLRAVADTLKANLGKYPKRLQRSVWMVRTSPSGMSSQEFTREIFNRFAASMVYQTKIIDAGIQQLRQLEETLVAAGIPRQETGLVRPSISSKSLRSKPLHFSLFSREVQNVMLKSFHNLF